MLAVLSPQETGKHRESNRGMQVLSCPYGNRSQLSSYPDRGGRGWCQEVCALASSTEKQERSSCHRVLAYMARGGHRPEDTTHPCLSVDSSPSSLSQSTKSNPINRRDARFCSCALLELPLAAVVRAPLECQPTPIARDCTWIFVFFARPLESLIDWKSQAPPSTSGRLPPPDAPSDGSRIIQATPPVKNQPFLLPPPPQYSVFRSSTRSTDSTRIAKP